MQHATVSAPRVLVDGRALLDPAHGGVFEYIYRLTQELKRSCRFEYTVWANAARAGSRTGIDVLTRYPNKLLNASMRLRGAPAFDRLCPTPPALAWLPNPHFFSVPPSLPLALTVHDLSFEIYPEFFSPKQRLWHHVVNPRALAGRADIVLAVSETTKRDMIERWHLPDERIVVTHEGVAPEFFELATEEELRLLRQKHRLPERFILHVGALEPRKNHLALLEAYHALRTQVRFSDLGLVLVGPSGWKNAAVRDALGRSPYRDDIRLLGYVSDADRRLLYRAASVLGFPSFYEGFGLPPVEAMASGLPVVASHASALGEMIADAGVLIDPYRPTELAEALAAVLDSPSLAERYVARGRERARRFTWTECAKKTEDAFARVLVLRS